MAGGKAIYVQADVTQEDQIIEAVKKVNDTFGDIHGAIHSAIVLKDQTITVMQEETLKEVLAPKVRGCVILSCCQGTTIRFYALFLLCTVLYW